MLAQKTAQLTDRRTTRRGDSRDRSAPANDGERLAPVLDGVEHVSETLGRVSSRNLSHNPIIGYQPKSVNHARFEMFVTSASEVAGPDIPDLLLVFDDQL